MPEGAASPAISAPVAPSTRIQWPNLRSRATRCGATVTITAAASATRTSGNDGASDAAREGRVPTSGQSPVASRVATNATAAATRTDSDALERHCRAPGDQRRDDEDERPQPEHVVEERPDRIEPAGEAVEERRERALELGRRIGGDSTPEADCRRHDEHDVRRAPEARPAARRRVDADAHPCTVTGTGASIAAAPAAAMPARAPSRLLARHGDAQALLGRDQVIERPRRPRRCRSAPSARGR